MHEISDEFMLVLDRDKPDYLIASEHIYRDKYYWKQFKKFYHLAKIRIFFAGEAMIPDFNLFDYGISYHNKLTISDRHHRLPPPMIFFNTIIGVNDTNRVNEFNLKEIIADKKKFCNFLYSNGNAHSLRDEIFFKVSEYKFVDSLGKHLNNMNNNPTGYEGYEGFEKQSTLLKKPYKFSIACENASFPGYTSEKIITSLQAHTVPIYWGNPDVCELFNPKAFINVHDFSSLDNLLKRIIEIDSSENSWEEIILEPWRTPKQIKDQKNMMKSYLNFLDNIFRQEIFNAERISNGTFPNVYSGWFFSAKLVSIRLYDRLLLKIKKYIKF